MVTWIDPEHFAYDGVRSGSVIHSRTNAVVRVTLFIPKSKARAIPAKCDNHVGHVEFLDGEYFFREVQHGR